MQHIFVLAFAAVFAIALLLLGRGGLASDLAIAGIRKPAPVLDRTGPSYIGDNLELAKRDACTVSGAG